LRPLGLYESPLNTPAKKKGSKEERFGREVSPDKENQMPKVHIFGGIKGEGHEDLKAKKKTSGLQRFGSSVLQNGNVIDIKTKLPYKALVKKTEDFENALVHQNMRLIQIFNDPSVLVRGNERIITKGEKELEEAKIYMALVGLQCYRKRNKKDRKQLKEYFSIITSRLKSDNTKLEELVTFFVTKKRKHLY